VNHRGFTLLEVIVVTGIIVTIAAIALPSLLESRQAADERAAIQYLRAWLPAQEMYRKKHGVYADADEQLVAAKLMTVTKGDGNGYKFALDNPANQEWEWWGSARPAQPGISGNRYFYVGMDGVVRYAVDRKATKKDPSVDK